MRAGMFFGGCVAFVVGVFFYNGCGGRILVAECKPGMQFCKQAVVCCPENTVCGTGEPNEYGYTCALGDCCPPFDAGDVAPSSYPPSYDPGEAVTGSAPAPAGGVTRPQPPRAQ